MSLPKRLTQITINHSLLRVVVAPECQMVSTSQKGSLLPHMHFKRLKSTLRIKTEILKNLEKVWIFRAAKRHQDTDWAAHSRIENTLVTTRNKGSFLNGRYHISNEEIGHSFSLLWGTVQVTSGPEGLCSTGIILEGNFR